MAHGKFGTAINCMDGRAQLPVINWMRAQYKLDYVDMITEPGADKVMAAGTFNQTEAVKAKALISVEKHGSRIIVIVGHDDCAGNPVTPEEHKAHLLKAVDKILAWKLPVDKVMAIWFNKDWRVEIVAEKKS
jgi:hypothetical protein